MTTEERDWLAERFEEHRTHLRAVGYRMLGSLSEADDAVQEAWLRLSRSDAREIENLGGWLTTVVARVCLNMLKARKARRGEPLGVHVPDPIASREDETAVAMSYLDQAVTNAGGIALRYGSFYGAANDGLLEPVRKRQFPIVGAGGGVSSFIHLDDAAAATVVALAHAGPAIYNIVDDEPAPVREWLPVLANALGARPPRHFPVWLARLFAGEPGVMLGTEARGASNAKAKRELGWTLRYPSWRQGFTEVYAKRTAERTTPMPTPARS